MGDCELCGSMSVTTRRVSYHKSSVEACTRCCEKMKLIPIRTYATSKKPPSTKAQGSGGYSKSGINNSSFLIDNFSKIISDARKRKQWSKKDLAKNASVRLIDVQNIESGKILEDKVVKKLEKTLGIELFTEEKTPDVRRVRPTGGKGMTLGDFFNQGD